MSAGSDLSRMNPQLREKLAFLIVGSVAAGCYVIFAEALYLSGSPPTLASVVAYSLCVPPTYLAQRRFTFRSARAHGAALGRYAGVQIVGLFVSTATTFLAWAIPGLASLQVFVLAAVVTASVSYLLQKHWVF